MPQGVQAISHANHSGASPDGKPCPLLLVLSAHNTQQV
nr:MAG TPA: hypothetical protein [Caudoviricetes sp.]